MFCKSSSLTLPVDNENWESISIPHSYNNLDGQDGGSYYYRGIVWYKKSFIPTKEASGKRAFLKFHAINRYAEVYLNNELVGKHTGGYSAFTLDITQQLKLNQQNLISVKVSNSDTILSPPLEADFTFYGGITRKVELMYTNAVHINLLSFGSSGVYITQTHVTNAKAELELKTNMRNDLDKAENIKIIYSIIDANGKMVKEVTSNSLLQKNETKDIITSTSIEHPHLWEGISNPYLYSVNVKVYSNGVLIDQVNQPLGIRYFAIDKDRGFYLNGKLYPLHGVAMHEEMQEKGSALTDEDRKTDLDILKELGCNYIRLSHYQHGNYTYEYCDSNGILVWTEIPLVNKIDNSKIFSDNTHQQMIELIRQNYNHPSVIIWGLSNEITFKPGPDPYKLIEQLHQLAKKEDGTRLTANAAMHSDAPLNFISDVYSCNVYKGWYIDRYQDFGPWADKQHHQFPEKALGISEYGAGGNPNQHEAWDPKEPVHNGPWHPEEYQTLFHEEHWKQMVKRPYLWSTSIWVAFDFASDTRNEGGQLGINDKGLVTRDRKLKKDAYYFYKANWTKDPIVYIVSRRFSERKDSLFTAKVYSNCDSVQLIINNQKLNSTLSNVSIFEWQNKLLHMGINTIQAIGYKNGKAYLDSCSWTLQASSEPKAMQEKFKLVQSPSNKGNTINLTCDLLNNQIEVRGISETIRICLLNEKGKKISEYKNVKPGNFSLPMNGLRSGNYKIEMKGKSSIYYYGLIIQ
jgi:beta-galactosidase